MLGADDDRRPDVEPESVRCVAAVDGQLDVTVTAWQGHEMVMCRVGVGALHQRHGATGIDGPARFMCEPGRWDVGDEIAKAIDVDHLPPELGARLAGQCRMRQGLQRIDSWTLPLLRRTAALLSRHGRKDVAAVKGDARLVAQPEGSVLESDSLVGAQTVKGRLE